jgi:hypothetical protein
VPRLRTVALAAVVVVVFTDVTWDGDSLIVSFGWPKRKPVASFVFPDTPFHE